MIKSTKDIPEKFINAATAIGDELNDWEMIEEVGMGIVMGNAEDSLKQKTRFVTRSLHEHGIADAVDKWILQHQA